MGKSFSDVSSRTYLSTLERGQKCPTLEKVVELASVLQVHPLTLIAESFLVLEPGQTLEALGELPALQTLPTVVPEDIAYLQYTSGSTSFPRGVTITQEALLSNLTMLTDTLSALVKNFSLENALLGEVVGGAVQKHARDWNLVREAVLGSGLHPNTPAYDIQQACCTGLEATILVANKIALGQIDAGIACGSDTASDAPIGANRGLQRGLIKLNAAKSTSEKIGHAIKLLKPSHLIP